MQINTVDTQVNYHKSHQNYLHKVKGSKKQVPYSHLIFNPDKELNQVFSHCKMIYNSISYLNSFNDNLKQQILEYTRKISVSLSDGSSGVNKKKTLFLDLDQTLIHSSTIPDERFTQRIQSDNITYYFNLRPYAIDFLIMMKEYYQIILYTAAEKRYAFIFLKYLNNLSDNAISLCLSRNECIQIQKGIFIKDIRILRNRDIKNMILVDNSPHSFGCNISNGIPILSFTFDFNDKELFYLKEYLIEAYNHDDLRDYNIQKLKLLKILEVRQNKKDI